MIHYVDARPETAEIRGTVLAIHGNPTWSFSYRKVIKRLMGAGYRVVAPDLYGFGMSDKPDLAAFDYFASSHARAMSEFVTALDLDGYTMLAQDWGGPIALYAATEAPERVAGLVLINTWAWEIERIPAGASSEMHVVHDWGIENVVNETYYRDSMQTPLRAARGLGFRNDPEQGAVFERIQNAYLGPFFTLDGETTLRHPDVIAPVNIFAQATVLDSRFLRALDSNMSRLYEKPIYFLFGDDTAFGPLKCDVGPSHSYDFDEPRGEWSAARQRCPADYVCETDQPEPLRSNCLDEGGQPVWPVVNRFTAAWQADKIVGVQRDPAAGHWLQETYPDEVSDAVIAVDDAAAAASAE